MELNVRNENGVLKFTVKGAYAVSLYQELSKNSKFVKKELTIVSDGKVTAFVATEAVTMTLFVYLEVFLNTNSYIVVKP